MPNHPIVIIGGDAAGMSAASKLKREAPDTEVIVFERDQHISYSACGIPYWIGGIVESHRDLIVLTPNTARRKRDIDVRIHHEATAIDAQERIVYVRNLETGERISQPYDKLAITTGASPTRPPIDGLDLPGVFVLRTLTDGQRIHSYMDKTKPRRAVIVGCGYIGVEMAEALRHRDLDVIMLEMLPQIMTNFDMEMVADVTDHLRNQGVDIRTGEKVLSISRQNDALLVTLADNPPIETDMVLVSTGVRPNVELAKSAGLRLGTTGAIWVDRSMRTSNEFIYAAGDCVEHYHMVLEENAWIPLATSANKGGRVLGDVLAGNPATFPGILGTAVVKVFDYTLATTGLTEKVAKASGRWGIEGEWIGATVIENADKAGYWPGVEKIKVKLVFDKRDGRILGGQLSGKGDVNKRIDIIATAIAARMTVEQLGLLDLSYAPPFSPTYDPVQVCANVALKDVLGEKV